MRGSKWAGRGTKWGGRLAFIFCFMLAATYLAAPAQALGKVKCGKTLSVAGVGVVDPIVHHGEPVGSGHEHMFFGSASFLNLPNPNNATLADFQGKPTLCDQPGDTAAGWMPTLRLRSTGELVKAQQITFYYRAANGQPTGAAQPIPSGAEMVAKVHTYSCGQFGGVANSQTFVDCRGLSGKPGRTLTLKVTFPSCWDGALNDHTQDVVGDNQDSAHFAYRVGKVCPAGFPIGVTELRETLALQYTGDPADLVLSSDAHDGVTDGSTLHADYIQAWDMAAFQAFINRCVVTQGTNCG